MTRSWLVVSSARLFLIVASVVSVACSEPRSQDNRDRGAFPPWPAVSGDQSDDGVPYGYGSCAEDPVIGRVGFPGEKPILVERVGPNRTVDDVEGFVVVQAIIDREGNVCSATVVRSLGPEADRAAIDAVKQWRFEPARLDGEPWPVEMHLTVGFRSGARD